MTVKGSLKTTLQLCFRTTPNVCLFYPGKKKATIGEDRLSLMCVGMRRLERPTPTSRT